MSPEIVPRSGTRTDQACNDCPSIIPSSVFKRRNFSWAFCVREGQVFLVTDDWIQDANQKIDDNQKNSGDPSRLTSPASCLRLSQRGHRQGENIGNPYYLVTL